MFNFHNKQSSHQKESLKGYLKSYLKDFWGVVTFWRRSFIHEDRGQIAALFATIIFFGFVFAGVAIDYNTYIDSTQEMKALGDSATLAGGIKCRQEFLRLKQAGNTPNQIRSAISPEVQHSAHDKFSNGTGGLPYSVTGEAITTSVTFDTNDPAVMPQKCIISMIYSGISKNSMTSLLGVKGFPIKGKSVATSILDQPPSKALEIDFLVDVSGSMSTIADTKDRDKVMYLTFNLAAPTDIANTGGCLFFCHMRRALLPGPASRRILNTIYTRPTMVTARYNEMTGYYSYDGGTRAFNINPPGDPLPSTIRTYRYIGPNKLDASNQPTNQYEPLIMLDDFLKAFKIELKSDVIYNNVKILVDTIKASGLPDTKMAFHNFSGNIGGTFVKTFLNQTPLNMIDFARDLAFYHFDYAGPNSQDPSAHEQPGFFPYPRVDSIPNFAPPTGSDSVTFNSVQSLPGYESIPIKPLTFLEDAVTELATIMRARPPSGPNVIRIAIVLTDGAVNTNGGSATVFNSSQCNFLKNDNVTVMVIHSYYRLQPGLLETKNMASRFGGQPPPTISNLDAVETAVNDRGLAPPLRACASPVTQPLSSGERTYYFPALDPLQLKKAFEDLIAAILALQQKGPPVRIKE